MNISKGTCRMTIVFHRPRPILALISTHPLLKPDKLFAALSGGVKFSNIDLTNAYSTNDTGYRFRSVYIYHHQHPPRSFHLPLWHCVSSSNFSTHNGDHLTETNRFSVLYWWHSGHRNKWTSVSPQPEGSAKILKWIWNIYERNRKIVLSLKTWWSA